MHYGVREHGMGAMVNGLVLHGFRAFGSTFFNFLDYMKPAVRLASLMHIPTMHVYTHDSIGLGEDGPTHQPVEQLATLRAQPNIYCVRPADANETALAWRFALEQTETPTALVLSRQGLPIQNPDDVPDDAIHRGAYVLRDASNGEPDLILIGTGSEVHICPAPPTCSRRTASPRAWSPRPVSTPSPSRTMRTATAFSRATCAHESRLRPPRPLAGAPGWGRMGTRSG